MLDVEVRRRLRRLFKAPAPLRAEHARELEGELMARFERLYPEEEKVPMRRLWWRKVLVVAAAAMIVGAAACAAPADMEVVVGRSVSIQVPAGAELPDPEALLAAVRGEKREGEPGERREQSVEMRVRMENGVRTLQLEVWGGDASRGGVAERIRAAFPALAGAEIREEALEGTVRGTLGEKLGHELLDLDVIDEGDVEEARRQVMAQLAAKGVEGKVDVQIEGGPGERRVKVRVEREECPPGEEPQAAPEPH